MFRAIDSTLWVIEDGAVTLVPPVLSRMEAGIVLTGKCDVAEEVVGGFAILVLPVLGRQKVSGIGTLLSGINELEAVRFACSRGDNGVDTRLKFLGVFVVISIDQWRELAFSRLAFAQVTGIDSVGDGRSQDVRDRK